MPVGQGSQKAVSSWAAGAPERDFVATSHTKPGRRRTVLIVSCIAVACASAVAVPKFLPSDDADDLLPGDTASLLASLPAKPSPAGQHSDADPTVAGEVVAAPAPVRVVATSKDGDLAVSIKLRWARFETGDRVLAKATFTNHSLREVWLPAAGEPSQGLAVVVRDAQGEEVRRVVEAPKGDQLPRSMAKLAAGASIEVPIVVVAEGESPLAPGTYSAHAELRPDPRLARLGLPLWTAPHGPLRSETVALVVTPATK
jgi:hypothetical protein